MNGFRTLQSKILFLFLSLLIGIEAAVFSLFATSYHRTVESQMDLELATGAKTFANFLLQRNTHLTFAARLLSADFAFKSAYATGESATISSALRNHGARIDADLMILTDLKGNVVANTLRPETAGKPFVYFETLSKSADDPSKVDFIEIDNKAYQLVLVPLKAPHPVAWIVLGFELKKDLATSFRQMTGLDVAIGSIQNGNWHPYVSSMESFGAPQGIGRRVSAEASRFEYETGGQVYLSLLSPLGGLEMHAVVLKNLSNFHKAWQVMKANMLLLFVLSLFATGAVGYFIARSVSRPVKALTASALAIANGALDTEIASSGTDEVGHLTEAFSTMTAKLKKQISATNAAYSELNENHQSIVKLNATLDRKLFETSTFLEISQAGQSGSVEDLLLKVFTRIMTVFQVERASVMLVNEDSRCFEVQFIAKRLSKETVVAVKPDGTFKMDREQGLAGQVLKTGKPIIIAEAAKDPRFSPYRDWRDGAAGSLVCLPVFRGDEPTGVINLIQAPEAEMIKESDLEFLISISGQISKILESLYHYQQSVTDGLTQLYNSKTFRDRLKGEIATSANENRSFGLLLFDVDHFKKFNDTFGHQQGDRVLVDVAKALTTVGRKIDFRARYGGEEFAMIMPGASRKEALEIAEALRSKIETWEYESLSGREIKVTISVGVAIFPDHAADSQAVIKAADDALYAAKRAGRNNCQIFEPTTGTVTPIHKVS